MQKDNPTNEWSEIIINNFVRNKSRKTLNWAEIMETLLSSFEATTLTSGDSLFNSSSVDFLTTPSVTTCSPSSPDCRIDHAVTCIGDVEYCNLTKEQYQQLLYDYISPTIPEIILIISHIVVFLMGLVSGCLCEWLHTTQFISNSWNSDVQSIENSWIEA